MRVKIPWNKETQPDNSISFLQQILHTTGWEQPSLITLYDGFPFSKSFMFLPIVSIDGSFGKTVFPSY